MTIFHDDYNSEQTLKLIIRNEVNIKHKIFDGND